MWRSLAALAIFYGGGHPGLDAYRPSILDRPLQGFHNNVNDAARDSQRLAMSIKDTRYAGYLKVYIAQMKERLRSSE